MLPYIIILYKCLFVCYEDLLLWLLAFQVICFSFLIGKKKSCVTVYVECLMIDKGCAFLNLDLAVQVCLYNDDVSMVFLFVSSLLAEMINFV